MTFFASEPRKSLPVFLFHFLNCSLSDAIIPLLIEQLVDLICGNTFVPLLLNITKFFLNELLEYAKFKFKQASLLDQINSFLFFSSSSSSFRTVLMKPTQGDKLRKRTIIPVSNFPSFSFA